jgi:hypothetical protein
MKTEDNGEELTNEHEPMEQQYEVRQVVDVANPTDPTKRQPRKRQDKIGKFLEVLSYACSADEMLYLVKMRPSEVYRILRSRTFRNRLQIERILTRTLLNRVGKVNVTGVMAEVHSLIGSQRHETARKACMVCLDQATRDPLAPEKPPRQGETHLEKMTKALFKLVETSAQPSTPSLPSLPHATKTTQS